MKQNNTPGPSVLNTNKGFGADAKVRAFTPLEKEISLPEEHKNNFNAIKAMESTRARSPSYTFKNLR